VAVGTIVRVPLHGRSVRGWVVGISDQPGTDRRLLPIARVSSVGPPPDLVALASWAAWRWAGPVTRFLGTASPPVAVRGLPPARARSGTPEGHGVTVARVAPAADRFGAVEKAAARGDALVLAPSLAEAAEIASRLRRAGRAVAMMPREWARAAAGGCVVVGGRAAAWAPVGRLAAAVVLDEHDEVYQEERAPTWHARDVVIERARRAGVPCVLTSPCPSLESLARGPLEEPARVEEREGWAVLEVIDRRPEPPGRGLYSERLVDVVRAATPERRVVCVLNRKGRTVLLACASCAELGRCERCDGPLESVESGMRCRRCGGEQPAICRWCGSTRFKSLRVGVTRAREELELLAGQPVAEVTSDSPGGPLPGAAVVVGTEAVLHRPAPVAAAVFLDFDQELLAPRYRASEQALTLLARAARLVGGRARGGRVIVQTRLPDHEALDAALHADPGRLAVVEGARRAALRLPPEVALARISGPGAEAVIGGLAGLDLDGIELLGPSGDRWLVRAGDHRTLCEALALAPRPSERVRIEVDPLRA
jgi:primosomal protein N' (replication factor Y)